MRIALRRHSAKCAVLAVASAFCASCIHPGLHPGLTVAVNIAADANHNQPIAVDVVQINDKDLSKDIAKMTAADWFQKREQIEEDFPKSKSLSVLSWEWVPGEVVPDIKIPMRRSPRLMLVFAGYSTPGPHRATLVSSKSVMLLLAREDIHPEHLAK